jgi:hypothetical protein
MKPISRTIRVLLVLTGIGAMLVLMTDRQSVHGESALEAGYGIVSADTGAGLTVGAALLSVTNPAGILVSRAGMTGIEAARSGRLLVDQAGMRTAIALVNPNSADATVTLTIRDSNGNQVARQVQTLRARSQLARYLTDLFSASLDGVRGSLTFESDQPLGAAALSEVPNGHGEPVYVTCPVNRLDAGSSPAGTVFPQLAAGDGYSTQLILTNPTGNAQHGQIRFTGQDGGPLGLNAPGPDPSLLQYEVPAQGTFRVDLNSSSQLLVGWGAIQPDQNSSMPMAAAVLRFQINGQIVTAACAPAAGSTTAARLLVDNSGTKTAVAMVNTADTAESLTLRLLDANGNLQSTKALTLGPRAQTAFFAGEVFGDLSDDIIKVLDIGSTGLFAALGLQFTVNARNDPLFTAIPMVDLTRPSPAPVIFPQVVVGGEFSTRLILVNTDQSKTATGNVRLYQPDGSDMPVAWNGTVGNRYDFQVPAGVSSQLGSPPLETVVYTNDFNGPAGTTYPEWSAAAYSWTGNQAGTIAPGSGTEIITNIDSYNSAQRFFGELGGPVILNGPPYDVQHFVRVDESVNLSLNSLPAHTSVTLAFDLYVLKSMDGNNPIYGPDRWQVAVLGGPTLLSTTFSNNFKTGTDLSLQDYPIPGSAPETGSFAANSLGYNFWFGDSSYHLSFTVPHIGNSITFVFSSSQNEGKSEPVHGTRDESWGLDNVRVTTQ